MILEETWLWGRKCWNDGLERAVVVVEIDVGLMQDLMGFPSIYICVRSFTGNDEEQCCKGRTGHHGIFDVFFFCLWRNMTHPSSH